MTFPDFIRTRIAAIAAIGTLLLAGTGCTTVQPPNPMVAVRAILHKPKPSYWRGDGVEGKPSIRIVLSEQRAYFYKGGVLVGESTISTGKPGFETPPGTYKVIQKDKDHLSNLYGDYVDADGNILQKNVDVTKDPMPPGGRLDGAKMPYFLRFTGGYGMHAGYLPGYAASHGCVRMPMEMAEHFFDAAEEGTKVTVEP